MSSKKNILIAFVFFIVNTFLSTAFSQSQPCVDFSLKRVGGEKAYTFESTFILKDSNRIIKAVYPNATVDEDHVYDEFRIILKKKTGQGFESVKAAALIDPFASGELVILNPGSPLKNTLFLDLFYHLQQGEYKVKVIRKVYIEGEELFISSNWVVFRVFSN